jgi:hypothetical protein
LLVRSGGAFSKKIDGVFGAPMRLLIELERVGALGTRNSALFGFPALGLQVYLAALDS